MRNKGFTLIEVLVSVAVFAVVVSIGAVLFISTANSQKKTISQERVVRDAREVMETISRLARTSPVSFSSYDQLGGKLGAGSLDGPQSALHLLIDEQPVSFFSEDGQVIYRDSNGIESSVTTDDVEISDLVFYITPSFPDIDDSPQKVTILLTAETGSDSPATGEKMSVQTTITSRLYADQ